ncbi:MAG TPA: hypothetical protein VMS23_04320, partial [Terrimicrobiaceae bacterium]|nr:hypothetical protein [Terrimicrobiaceae bacterium]
IRNLYQFWFFFYPTGQPIPYSSKQLREALTEAASRRRLQNPFILVGHSMGGSWHAPKFPEFRLSKPNEWRRESESSPPGMR